MFELEIHFGGDNLVAFASFWIDRDVFGTDDLVASHILEHLEFGLDSLKPTRPVFQLAGLIDGGIESGAGCALSGEGQAFHAVNEGYHGSLMACVEYPVGLARTKSGGSRALGDAKSVKELGVGELAGARGCGGIRRGAVRGRKGCWIGVWIGGCSGVVSGCGEVG
jgi:hypothetical protein